MRRFTIGFTVVVLVLLFASVAGAVPPDPCDKGEDHPLCTTTTEPSSSTTTTTTTEAPTELEPCPDQMTIVGKATTVYECLWRPINDGSDVGTVTISKITGAIPGPPVVFVRDDSPGDLCVLMQDDDWADQTGPEYVAEFDLFYNEVPEGYEAWLGHSYWGFVLEPGMEPGTHWCAPQDPNLGVREDTNGGALHLLVSFNAKKGGSVTFTLSPGNSL